ncbi:MAG TPA: hypothetical protein VHW04_03090 [Solirubrobacteraceae bacterium]|nr:hypothetical protein [Solirubrobacteraceae bacterium]
MLVTTQKEESLRKSLVIAVTAAVMLIAAASAYAAINTYTAKDVVSPAKAGTAKKPVSVGYSEALTATGTAGNRTAELNNIKTTIYGLKLNAKGLPTCSVASIAAAKSDTACPKGAMLATGDITAVIGSPTNFSTTDPTATACDPDLHVWNAGGGNMAFFFVEAPGHLCAGGAVTTGAVPPYPASRKQQGKNLVVNVPIPKYVTQPLGLAGSLETEHLKWFNLSTKVHGKKVGVLQSIGCQNGKRPYSVSFNATLPTTNTTETKTVSGKQACSK